MNQSLMNAGSTLPLPTLSPPTLSLVVPCYNEADNIDTLQARLATVLDGLGCPWEILYVNDGSRDLTLPRLEALHARDSRVGVLNLSRNFGKEIAMTAGLEHTRGQAVVVIDADLQDPPEIIPALIAGWREGFDVVYAQRRERQGETWLKKTTASGFYRLMSNLGGVTLPRDTGDFRLLSRRAVDSLLRLREQHRFMKGLFAWIGFPSKAVLYDRSPRNSGGSQFNYWKLWNLALEGITSFTVMPLKVASYFGLAVSVLAGLYAAQMLLRTMLFGNPVAGYPSLMAVILFLGGAQMLTLGVIGEYLGRIFNETKQRPLYLVERHLAARATNDPAPISGIEGVVPERHLAY